MYHRFPKNIKQHNSFNTDNKSAYTISEGSCDTEEWSNGWWKFQCFITEIKYILKYNKIGNQY